MSSFIAHLDLKGVRLRPAFLPEYLENLQTLGFRALVVEYEDVFPFRSARVSMHPEEVWSRDFLETFLAKAHSLGIEIIPLQQCLGHLEYAFRREENRPYAFGQGVPRDLHLGRPEARQWLKGLLAEVLEAHPASRYVHIGMDEARSLHGHAKEEGTAVLTLFLEYLDELCTLCERYGKTPLIWGDMLDESIAPEHLGKLVSFKDRLIVVSWDYASEGEAQAVVRFSGVRCSRRWVEEPWEAPLPTPAAMSGATLWFEDWPEAIQSLVEPYRVSPWAMASFFQAAVWRDLGFTVWGAAGGAVTYDRSVLPYYVRRHRNIAAWKTFGERERLGGIMITQWARSNSLTVPNVLPDVVWPVLAGAGAGLERFFKGVAPDRLKRLFGGIGRCREGWAMESGLLAEMAELTGQLQTHHEEWETIRLMLELQRITKGAEVLEEFMRCYGGIGRLPGEGWEKQAETLEALEADLQRLEERTRDHLQKRYFGIALEEWHYKAFTSLWERLSLLGRAVAGGVGELI
ncbi:MAG TPA: family 20 glycosylhydrolase [Chthoniobacteraceae bacterium]|nr:family 20 glycosylhydrolase [Chthoniobacteraceae bacterium]